MNYPSHLHRSSPNNKLFLLTKTTCYNSLSWRNAGPITQLAPQRYEQDAISTGFGRNKLLIACTVLYVLYFFQLPIIIIILISYVYYTMYNHTVYNVLYGVYLLGRSYIKWRWTMKSSKEDLKYGKRFFTWQYREFSQQKMWKIQKQFEETQKCHIYAWNKW